jgi:hypothetical protein
MLSNDAWIRQIIAHTDRIGARLPKAVQEAVERRERHRATLAKLTAPADLSGVVLAALDAGTDPATDTDVQRVIAAQRLVELRSVLQIGLEDELVEALTDHGDAIVAAWRKPFNNAAATLADAAKHIGAHDLDDTGAVLSHGGDAADMWVRAREAQRVIDAALTGWAALMTLCRTVSATDPHKALRMAALDVEQWQSIDQRHATAWDLCRLGATLSLPTAAEYRKRVEEVEGALNRERMYGQSVEAYREARAAGAA